MRSPACGLVALCLLLPTTAPRAQGSGGREVEVLVRALDEHGAPIEAAGVAVAAWPTTDQALREPLATSDADGRIRFRVTIAAGISQGTLLLAARGHSSFRYQLWRAPFPLVTGPRMDIGDVRLPRGHTMTGRVRDANGDPVAGARVIGSDLLAPAPLFQAYASHARTDERGVFVLRSTVGHAMALKVQADGYYELELADVRPGTPLDLTLATSGYYAGRAVNAEGQPFNGFLRINSEYFDPQFAPHDVRDGAFRVPVRRRGRCRLTLFDQTAQIAGESALLDGPNEQIEIESNAGEDSELFVVRAVDGETGEAVTAFRASAVWHARTLEPWMVQMLQWNMQTAVADGGARLQPDAMAGDEALVLVLADGYAPALHREHEFRPGEDCAIKLSRGATVTGRVVDEATGEGMAAVAVEAILPDQNGLQWPAEAITAADGTFRLVDLPAGRCRLVARHPGGTAQGSTSVQFEAGSESNDVTLTVPKGVAVRGHLRGGDFTATDWRVAIGPAASGPARYPGYDLDEDRPITTHLVDGRFELPRRAPEQATLFLIAPQPPRGGAPLWIPLQELEIATTDVAIDIDVTAKLPCTLHGRIEVRGAELPMDRLAVHATDGKKIVGSCLAEADGSYRMFVSAGTHELVVADSATGIPVHGEDRPVELTAAKQLRRDLVVPLATLHLRFDTTASQISAQSLEVRAETEFAIDASTAHLGGTRMGHPGIDLTGHNRAATVFVAPGSHQLVVHHGANAIRRGVIAYSLPAATAAQITLSAGEVRTETLPAPETPPIQTR